MEYSDKSKLRTFIAACIGMSFFGVSMITLGTVLPTLSSKLNLNTLQVSSIVAFLPIGILLGSLIFGPICDKKGHKRMFILSCIAVLIGLIGIGICQQFYLLQAAISIIGLGGGVLNGETNALVADIYGDKERGSKLSLLGAFYGFGAIGIPLLTGLLSKYYDYSQIIIGISIVMAICIVYCLTVSFPKPKETQSFPFKQAINLLKERSLLLLSFILFFESGIEGVTNNWTTLYLSKTTDISPTLILQTLTCMVVALTIARIILSFILPKISNSKILLSSLCIAAIGFGFMIMAQSFIIAALGMVFIGIGVASTYPIILNIVRQEYMCLVGTAFGIAMTISIIGNTLINSSVGIVADAMSLKVIPYMMILSIIIMIILFKIHSILISKKTNKLC